MKIYENGYRWKNWYKYNEVLHKPYDYERFGLLKVLLPKRYLESKNTIFNAALNVIEKPFVFIMKQVDYLRNYRNFNWKNY